MNRLIGRVLVADSRPRVVVGVMPASFRFVDEAPDLLLPDAAGDAAAAAWRQLVERIGRITTVGRVLGEQTPVVPSERPSSAFSSTGH